MDGGAWKAAVHGVAKSRTRLSDFTFTFHFPALEKEMATHSTILAWRIPGTAEPGGLPSMWSNRVGHDWSDLAAAAMCICKSQTTNLSLPHFPFGNHVFVFYFCESLCFINKFIFIIFLDSLYKQCHMILVFLWLNSLNMIISRSTYVAANSIIPFFL